MKEKNKVWARVFGMQPQKPIDFIHKINKHLRQRRKLFQAVTANLGNLQHKVIVEVGCGTAVECMVFSLMGAMCLGIDYENESLKYAARLRRVFSKRFQMNLTQGDGFCIPVKDNGADFVFSQGFLEHFSQKDVVHLVSEQVRALKPGGLLLIDVPNLKSPYEIYKRVYTVFGEWAYGNERGMTKKELIDIGCRIDLKYLGGYGWSFKGYPYRNVLDLMLMAPLLLVRNCSIIFGKGHDSFGLLFSKQ
jgi:ubiquinone/menaquinone biosynthesis C-methylase UbiE